jgi:hypothetical protein
MINHRDDVHECTNVAMPWKAMSGHGEEKIEGDMGI